MANLDGMNKKADMDAYACALALDPRLALKRVWPKQQKACRSVASEADGFSLALFQAVHEQMDL